MIKIIVLRLIKWVKIPSSNEAIKYLNCFFVIVAKKGKRKQVENIAISRPLDINATE